MTSQYPSKVYSFIILSCDRSKTYELNMHLYFTLFHTSIFTPCYEPPSLILSVILSVLSVKYQTFIFFFLKSTTMMLKRYVASNVYLLFLNQLSNRMIIRSFRLLFSEIQLNVAYILHKETGFMHLSVHYSKKLQTELIYLEIVTNRQTERLISLKII